MVLPKDYEIIEVSSIPKECFNDKNSCWYFVNKDDPCKNQCSSMRHMFVATKIKKEKNDE